MRIRLNGVHVNDQAEALAFYADVLGFQKKEDIPLGEFRWLTVVSPEEPGGTELLLEPDNHPAAQAYKSALYADGIPAVSFEVADIDAEFTRLAAKNVVFTTEPTSMDGTKVAVLDDTCGNLVMLYQKPEA